MPSVKLKFRPSTMVGRAGSLYYQVIHARVTRRLKLPYPLYPDEWDAQRGGVIVPAGGPRRAALVELSAHLSAGAGRWAQILGRYGLQADAFTADDLVAAFLGRAGAESFFTFSRGVVAALEDNRRLRTAEAYRAALASFSAFVAGRDVSLEAVTPALMERYEAWLRQRGVGENGSSFYLRILRALYNRAVRADLVADARPFREVYTGVARTGKRAVDAAVVRRLAALDLTGRPALAFARDMFLFSFYTRGMAFVDMAYLQRSQVAAGRLVYRRRKTGQWLSLRWEPCMQALADRYVSLTAGGYLLPLIRCEGTEAARRAYLAAAHRVGRNLRTLGRMLGLAAPLTMYVARHAWASIARSRGVPLAVISEGMGHDSESTTRIYLASLDEGTIDRANRRILDWVRTEPGAGGSEKINRRHTPCAIFALPLQNTID